MTKRGPRIMVVGRNDKGERVAANADYEHELTREVFESGEPFGDRLTVTRDEKGRNIGRLAPTPGL